MNVIPLGYITYDYFNAYNKVNDFLFNKYLSKKLWKN